MTKLASWLAGEWQTGEGEGTVLVNPTTDAELARASSAGLDLGAALAWARDTGGPALRALSFAERGRLLAGLADGIHAHREELIELGISNAGNTRGDAKFDIDGATATLAAYAAMAEDLPDLPFLPDGQPMVLGRSPRWQGSHVWVPRHGVAVHINAFNFPAWGMLEKLACAVLAGVPVLEKPGTPTAMMAERIAHVIVDEGLLPEGVFSFLCGSAGDLLDHLGPQDMAAFTGSSSTAAILRRHDAFVLRGARLNVEADSLNAMVLGPDVDTSADVFDAFVRDATRDMTQKTGQKCTATRRILVPEPLVDEVCEALCAALANVAVGNPAERGTRMGPLTNSQQLDDVTGGIGRLADAGTLVTGGPDRLGTTGCFIGATLVRAADAGADVFHADEVFGPVASVLPYDGTRERAAWLVQRGGGSLVSSVYSDDRSFPADLALDLAPWSGRVYLGSSRIAEYGLGPGLVLPELVHGGPGRAGGGEELGGLRGLQFSMQRVAVQGFKAIIEQRFSTPA